MTRYHRDPLFWLCLLLVILVGGTLLDRWGPTLGKTEPGPAATPTIAVTVRPAPTLVTIEAGSPVPHIKPTATATPRPEAILTPRPTWTPSPTPEPSATPTEAPTPAPTRTVVIQNG